MKKIITLGVFFSLFAWMQANAQTATSNCSQVIVTNEGFIPSRTSSDRLIRVNSATFTTHCNWLASSFDYLPDVRFILQKKDNTGVFVYQSLQDDNFTFSNLTQGTYRVLIQHWVEEQGSCVNQTNGNPVNGPFDVYDSNHW